MGIKCSLLEIGWCSSLWLFESWGSSSLFRKWLHWKHYAYAIHRPVRDYGIRDFVGLLAGNIGALWVQCGSLQHLIFHRPEERIYRFVWLRRLYGLLTLVVQRKPLPKICQSEKTSGSGRLWLVGTNWIQSRTRKIQIHGWFHKVKLQLNYIYWRTINEREHEFLSDGWNSRWGGHNGNIFDDCRLHTNDNPISYDDHDGDRSQGGWIYMHTNFIKEWRLTLLVGSWVARFIDTRSNSSLHL